MTALTIYLLCHNRPNDARNAIISILAQSDLNFNFIVSDNSSDNRLATLMEAEYPTIQYIRRIPMLASLEHFNRCITEVDTDYFCLFHDDDLLEPNFVLEMKKQIGEYPDAIGFACNAYIEKSGFRSKNLFFRSHQVIEKIHNIRTLAQRYYARSQSGIAPFPSYIYNKKSVGNIRIEIDGGKYADTTWLLNLSKLGYMIWLNLPLMTYRLHEGNDSNRESRADRLSVLAYLKAHIIDIGVDILEDYRCSFIYKTIVRDVTETSVARKRIAQHFLKSYQLLRYTRTSTYAALFRRMIVKLLS